MDSQAMAMLYTHEWELLPIPNAPNQTTITSNNWYSIVQGVTNNLAPYHPVYVTLDYHSQYARATHTSRMLSADYDSDSGEVTAAMTGSNDLDMVVYVYGNGTNAVTASYGVVPPFSGTVTNIVGMLKPPSAWIDVTKTNTVLVTWTNSLATSTNSNVTSLPNAPPGCVLQESENSMSGDWTLVTNAPLITGNQSQVVLPLNPGTNCFYRLTANSPQTQY
jgi:hypothetical protein